MSKNKAFTLIELLLVVALISILTAIGVVYYTGTTVKARDNKRKADLELIRSALEMYRSENNEYPATASYSTDISSYLPNGVPTEAIGTRPGYTYIVAAGNQSYCLEVCLEKDAANSTCTPLNNTCSSSGVGNSFTGANP